MFQVFDTESKIIHVMRNPKDVAVSYYYYIEGMDSFQYSGSFNGFMKLFMDGVFQGPLHGNWFDYELGWWNACNSNPNVLFITYEDLKKDTFNGIKGLADFLGKSYSDDFLREVVEKCSFDVMKKDISGKEDSWRWVMGRGSIFRKGQVGDWKRHFTVADNDCFDVIFEDKMHCSPQLRNNISFEINEECC